MKAQCKPKDIEKKKKTTFEAHLSNLKQKQKDDTKDAPTRPKLKWKKTNMTNEII